MTARKNGTAARKTKPGHTIFYDKDNGRPGFVLLDIREYQRLLEIADDREDVQYVKAMRKKPRQFISLEDYVAKRGNK